MFFTVAKLVTCAVLLLLSWAAPSSAAPVAGICSPVLPPSIPECRATITSYTVSRQLEKEIRSNLLLAHENITAALSNATCHPDYVRLSQVDRGTAINVPAPSSDYTVLGRAVGQLEKCFYQAFLSLVDSESRVQMDLQSVHFNLELSSAVQHIVSAVAPLKRLVMSDSTLTQGTRCNIPEGTCLSSNFTQTRSNGEPFTAGEIRFRQLVNVFSSAENYLDDLERNAYWDLNN